MRSNHTPLFYTLYTDGGYFDRISTGGWGVIAYQSQQPLTDYKQTPELELYRQADWQANSCSLEMELTAAISAVQSLESYLTQHAIRRYKITVLTDSRILIEGLEQKLSLWQKNGWLLKSGNEVKFKNLWQTLNRLTAQHAIHWQWIKAHNGITGNVIADQLARDAALNKQRLSANITN